MNLSESTDGGQKTMDVAIKAVTISVLREKWFTGSFPFLT